MDTDLEGPLGCVLGLIIIAAIFFVGWCLIVFLVWLFNTVIMALQAFWQFLVGLVTAIWAAIIAAVTSFLHFLFHPLTLTSIVALGFGYLLLLGLKKYLASLRVQVGEDEALIIERWGQYHTTLYRGKYVLPFGAYVRRHLSLKPVSFIGNEDIYLTRDHLRVRLRCTFDYFIVDPRLAQFHVRRLNLKLQNVLHQALDMELMQQDFATLLSQPEMICQTVAERINLRISQWGLASKNFQIEELIQPDDLLRLQRSTTSGKFWRWSEHAQQLLDTLPQRKSDKLQ